jgi:hypothetical protein
MVESTCPGREADAAVGGTLFQVEPARCRQVLEAMVHAGQLVTDGRMFALPDNCGRSIWRRPHQSPSISRLP